MIKAKELFEKMKTSNPFKRHDNSQDDHDAGHQTSHDSKGSNKDCDTAKNSSAEKEPETAWKWIKRNLSAKGIVSLFLLSLLVGEALLTMAIIARVKYTEIDWQTYMQQVSSFMDGELDYKNLGGDTGPLVYPAGFLYVYSFLYMITAGGQYIFIAQFIFALVYLVTFFLVVLIYRRSRIFPFWAIPLLMLSRRNHSIYVLRLFNDPIAMMFMFSSILALTKRQFERASIWFSLALSIKMNILLFAPGFAWVFLFNAGIMRSIMNAGLVAITQVIIAAPFIYTAPHSYVTRAFDFGRQFLHQWTVNWRFVPEEIFVSKEFALALLVMQIATLVLFSAVVWRRHIPRYYHAPHKYFKFLDFLSDMVNELKDDVGISHQHPEDEVDYPISPDDTILILFSCNLIGIVFARSLHYQFYNWYFFTLPYLLWRSGIDIRAKLAVFFLIEWAWNVYPSSHLSSGTLALCHVIIVASLVVGHPVYDSKLKGVISKDQKTSDKKKIE
ncbi:hypothetical protein BDV3_003396 [Batrachochytrium dendrobatidis]